MRQPPGAGRVEQGRGRQALRLFYLTRELTAEDAGADAGTAATVGLRLAQDLPAQSVHLTTGYELGFILQALKQAGRPKDLNVIKFDSQLALLEKHPGLRRIGVPGPLEPALSYREFLAEGPAKAARDIALISPFGAAIGDAVMFCTVVREYVRQAEADGRDVRLHLFQAPFNESVRELCARAELFASIQPLPTAFDNVARLEAYVDFSRPLASPQLPWVDAQLELGGMPPHAVPPVCKRNRMTLPPSLAPELEALVRPPAVEGRAVVIFHRLAGTPIRSMPVEVAGRLLDALLEATDYEFISLTPFELSHPRFRDLSHLSRTHDHYARLISLADAFVTVDTSLYHLADAFDVPGVVIFTNNPPERFAAYYPYVKGLHLHGTERLGGKHWSEDGDDIAYAEELWRSLDPAAVTGLLRRAVALKPPAGTSRPA